MAEKTDAQKAQEEQERINQQQQDALRRAQQAEHEKKMRGD
jgi:hypothetical protein